MRVKVHIRRTGESGSVQAYCPDLPGCSGTAPTEDAALRIVRKRILEYFASDRTEPLPPKTRRVELEV